MVSGLLMSLLDNMSNEPVLLSDYPFSPIDIESTITELEKDCDTLENEANRLLNINRELRVKLGDEVPNNLDFLDESIEGERSFATELIENGNRTVDEAVRPGPEGQEREDAQGETKSVDDGAKPRYTLFELEEVLNEKNKYKGINMIP